MNGNARTIIDIPDDVTLEMFQKFRPPTFNGEMGDEIAKKWIEAMKKIYRALRYRDDRKSLSENFSWKVQLKNGGHLPRRDRS